MAVESRSYGLIGNIRNGSYKGRKPSPGSPPKLSGAQSLLSAHLRPFPVFLTVYHSNLPGLLDLKPGSAPAVLSHVSNA